MNSAQMGATHIHRGLLSDDGGTPVDESTWSSVYLQAGDVFLMRKLAKLAKLNNNASLAYPLRHWALAPPPPHWS
jgi:hypothetical protein